MAMKRVAEILQSSTVGAEVLCLSEYRIRRDPQGILLAMLTG